MRHISAKQNGGQLGKSENNQNVSFTLSRSWTTQHNILLGWTCLIQRFFTILDNNETKIGK